MKTSPQEAVIAAIEHRFLLLGDNVNSAKFLNVLNPSTVHANFFAEESESLTYEIESGVNILAGVAYRPQQQPLEDAAQIPDYVRNATAFLLLVNINSADIDAEIRPWLTMLSQSHKAFIALVSKRPDQALISDAEGEQKIPCCLSIDI